MCKYCEVAYDEEGIPLIEGDLCNERMTISKEDDGYHIDCYGSLSGRINYCPMCGTPLNSDVSKEALEKIEKFILEQKPVPEDIATLMEKKLWNIV